MPCMGMRISSGSRTKANKTMNGSNVPKYSQTQFARKRRPHLTAQGELIHVDKQVGRRVRACGVFLAASKPQQGHGSRGSASAALTQAHPRLLAIGGLVVYLFA